MEGRIVLILLIGIVVVLGIAYYLSMKQNRELKKKLIKQEPQLNYSSASAESEESSSHRNNLFFDDEASEQKSTSFDPASREVKSTVVKPRTDRNANITNLSMEIICLIILAPLDRPHSGYELLQSLLSAGLRYGPMNIFHRFDDSNGRGKILFSVASVEEPGTFEINKMGGYSGKGLMMFLRFSSNKDLTAAFEIMLDTAKQLVEDLGGHILDDEKQSLSNEKIEKWRKKIANFEEKQLTPDLFDV